MTARRWLVQLLLGVLVLLMVVGVAVPNTTLAWLRHDFRWIGALVNWVEALWPAWNTVHLLLFGALGFLARLAVPRWPLHWVLVGLVAFAAGTEIVQFWAPGRMPRLTDFAQDVGGAVLGLALAVVLSAGWSIMTRTRAAAKGESFDG